MLQVQCGHVPGNDAVGHNRIHHTFDNGPADSASTLGPARGRLPGRLTYRQQFPRFWSGASVVSYCLVRNRRALASRQERGMLVCDGTFSLAARVDWQLALGCSVRRHQMIMNSFLRLPSAR